MKKIKIGLVQILVMVNLFLFAQENKTVDSLRQVLKTAKHDTVKLRILDKMIEAENDDKKWSVYNEEIKILAEKLLADKPSDIIFKTAKKYLSSAINNIGYIYTNQGDITKAIEFFNKSIKIREEIGDKKGMANSFNNIGSVYDNQGDITKAIEYYNRSLKIYEEIGDKKGMANSFNNIGYIYKQQGDISKAIEYYNKSLKIQEEIGDKKGMANSFNNIGAIYTHQGDFPKALEYFNKSLKIQEEIDDKKGVAYSFNNIGAIYNHQGETLKAIEYHNKSLKIYEEIVDKKGMAYSFNYIGGIYLAKKDLINAGSYAEKAYRMSKELGFPENIERAARLQKIVFKNQGNYQKAFKYYQEEILMRDSINNKENFKKTQKQQAKYEYEKRATTDSIIHCKAMEIKNIEVKKQKTVIGFAVIGILLILAVAVIIFRSLRITHKQKRIIEKQKLLVDEKNVLLNQQKEEIEMQRDTVTQQKEHIEEIYHEISDSINYAKRIQQAVLPTGDYANNILGNHFILFHPKDVVSGDFYWATKVNEWLIVTVADCTGHGVPGAFMSMLGISFLNEIVRKKEVTQASQVLDQLRNSVIDALKQKGEYGEQKDGMDITLIVLNSETLECQFAGANNPLYLIQNDTKELIEVKPDKMPVAIYENMKPFTNHVIQLQKDDIIYLTSDGYEDQFGGPKHKKFLSKNMKELLKTNSQFPMPEQKELLEKAMNNWKGDNEQIDDITVMGIRIS